MASKVRSIESMSKERDALIAKASHPKTFISIPTSEKKALNKRCALLETAIKYRESLPHMTDDRILEEKNRIADLCMKITDGYEDFKKFNPDILRNVSDPRSYYLRTRNYSKHVSQLAMFRFMCGEIEGPGVTASQRFLKGA